MKESVEDVVIAEFIDKLIALWSIMAYATESLVVILKPDLIFLSTGFLKFVTSIDTDPDV